LTGRLRVPFLVVSAMEGFVRDRALSHRPVRSELTE